MNSCVLMAKIIRTPELRYTQENQTPFTQMLIEFESLQPKEPPATLRAVGWGNLAIEISQKYVEGDQVILEGRISIQNFDRPEGFKEKRAELVISHIYRVDGQISAAVSSSPTMETTRKPSSTSDNVVPLDSAKTRRTEMPATPAKIAQEFTDPEPVRPVNMTVSTSQEQDLDEIPF